MHTSTAAAATDAGRTLHLIDLENLTGSPFSSAAETTRAIAAYRHLVYVRAGDQVMIAVNANNPEMVFAANQAWAGSSVGCLVKVAHGQDGADRVLVGECAPQWASRRFARVVIGSGDHIFADVALALSELGTLVAVVSRRGSLAWTLRRAAAFVRLMPDTEVAAVVTRRPTIRSITTAPRRRRQARDASRYDDEASFEPRRSANRLHRHVPARRRRFAAAS